MKPKFEVGDLVLTPDMWEGKIVEINIGELVLSYRLAIDGMGDNWWYDEFQIRLSPVEEFERDYDTWFI